MKRNNELSVESSRLSVVPFTGTITLVGILLSIVWSQATKVTDNIGVSIDLIQQWSQLFSHIDYETLANITLWHMLVSLTYLYILRFSSYFNSWYEIE